MASGRRIGRTASPAGVALAVALGLGCSALAPPSGPAGAAAPRVMATLKPLPPPLLDKATQEIASTHGLAPLASWEMASLGRRCVVFAVGRSTVERAVRALAADPRVEIAQPVQRFETLGGGDPYRKLQASADRLGLDAAHRLATGRGVTVAVVDTGVDIDHPELRDRIVAARDFTQLREGFTRDRHGTAVAGVLAASADNGVGIIGVAPEARLLALKACWPEGADARRAVCDSYTLALALDFAVVSAPRLVNLSLGGPPDEIVAALVRAALERGIAVVAAAGDDSAGPGFPASLAGVVAVRALAPGGAAGVLAAPGTEVLAPAPGGSFDFFSGSSLAAAEVTGVAALVLERRPELLPADLAAWLRASARAGLDGLAVDACRAVAGTLDGGAGTAAEVSAPACGT